MTTKPAFRFLNQCFCNHYREIMASVADKTQAQIDRTVEIFNNIEVTKDHFVTSFFLKQLALYKQQPNAHTQEANALIAVLELYEEDSYYGN